MGSAPLPHSGGWLITLPKEPIWHPSPNFGPRRDGAKPDVVVLHYTGMESCDAARDRLCDPQAEVSAHYLISETGTCWQLVEEDMRAWHAGVGQWGDVTDVNSRSIGIELANTGSHPFPEPQMTALEHLLSDVMHRYRIAPERVIAHSDMAPDRKYDPGPRFDWYRLAASDLSIWPQDHDNEAEFTHSAYQFGYSSKAIDNGILQAFRSRFRPWEDGPLDATDCALMADLAQRFPFDGPPPAA